MKLKSVLLALVGAGAIYCLTPNDTPVVSSVVMADPPIPDTIINIPCDKKPEMLKFVNLFPYPDTTYDEWYIPASGTCNGPYWQLGQFQNTLCALDTVQSKLGFSCNPLAKFLDSITKKPLPVDCFMQDSSDNRFVLRIDPKNNVTLSSFSVHYAYVKESMMSVPQNKPNLAKTFVIKAFEENGTFLGRWSVPLATYATKDSSYWVKFDINLNLQAGKKYKLNIFGMDPFYPLEVNTNPPIWEALGFKAVYSCSGLQGTCNWDSVPKKIWQDPFYEFPCNASEMWEWKSSCGKSYIAQYNFFDNDAPVITKCPKDVTISLPKGSCEIDYTVPPVEVSDNCAVNLRVQTQTPYGDLDNGGVIYGVRAGVHKIIYTAEDICGNVGTPCSYNLTVKETGGGFNLVCKGSTVVSLNDSCVSVSAKLFVVDAVGLCCRDYTVYGKRLDNNQEGENVKFCCADVGKKIRLCLTVVSNCDTSIKAQCFVDVEVQNKSAPRITCPLDLTVSCDTFDILNLSKYGKASATANCGVSIKDTFVNSLNDCKFGTVVRTFTATASNGMTATCSQTITVINANPLKYSDIIWPRDTTFYDCYATYDSTRAGLPSVSRAYKGCSKALHSYSDQVFFAGAGGICKKILRTWKVIDCCYPYNRPWEKVQVITLRDNVRPVITFCPKDTSVGNLGACTDSVLVNLESVTAIDCGGILKITNDSKYAFAKGANATGRYPNGVHKVTFTVYDSCGSTNICAMTITVSDKKAPSLICVNIATDVQDCPPDGIGQKVDVNKLILKKEDNCCPSDRIIASFAKDTLIKSLWFDCSKIGLNVVEVWITDCNGNQEVCKPTIDIQDNFKLCPPTFKDTLMIAGVLVRPNGREVEEVQITLDSTSMVCSGSYKFDSLAPKNYKVTPFKDEYPTENVSTQDLIKIQRYILRMDTSLTPYQMIASDANKDNKITTADISEIRKLILGIIPTFTKNTSWRFVPKAYQFPSGAMNWNFPEFLNVGYGTPPGDVLDADFYGIKIGDVNGSANTFQGDDENEFLSINGIYLPESEKVILEIPKEFGKATITIVDLRGIVKTILQNDKSNAVLDLEKYPSGIYLVSVLTENWDEPYYIKVLKL